MTTRTSKAQSQESHPTGPTARHNRRTVTRILLALFGLLLLLLILAAARIGLDARNAYGRTQDVLTLLGTDEPLDQIGTLEERLDALNGAMTVLQRDVNRAAPALDAPNGVGTLGTAAAALPDLTDAGATLLAVGEEIAAALAPELATSTGDAPLARLTSAMDAQSATLVALADDAQRGSNQLLAVDPAGLPTRIGPLLSKAQTLAPILPAMLKMTPSLPGILGFDTPKTYLVLVQNNHELRATGGFITAIGRVTIEDGRISDLNFVDSYQIFRQKSTYPPAPAPMQEYMGLPLMLMRDANWSPDLPTTAALATSLYQQDTNIAVDGIVTIDLRAVELLVGALGSLQVEGAERPITGDNVVDVVKQFWDRPIDDDDGARDDAWWFQRKEFMPTLAGAALMRLQGGDVDPIGLVQAGVAALNERAIQIVLNDPTAAAVLRDLGWDGSLQPTADQDFLAVIDTNMGYNKVDSVLQRGMDYTVEWPGTEGEPAVATLTIEYEHPLGISDYVCDQPPRYGESYDEMTLRCYFDYVRVYVPVGSELISVAGLDADSVTSRRGEKATQVFGGFFTMMPGEKREVVLRYTLPPAIQRDGYVLTVQRQAGTKPLPLRLTIAGETFETTMEGNRLDWQPD